MEFTKENLMTLLKELATEERISIQVDIVEETASAGDGRWNVVRCRLQLDDEAFVVEGNVDLIDPR